MGNTTSAPSQTVTEVKWMWKSNADPFSKSEPAEWKNYSDVENIIIEDAFKAGKRHVLLDVYSIDFKLEIQILNTDSSKQRPIKRMVCDRNDNYIREERYTFTPVNPTRPFGGLYGWVSPFIRATAKHLNLTYKQLPSKDNKFIPMIVESAAAGIIEEGKKIGKQREAEQIARILRTAKYAKAKEVWECCAYLYTLESFLYKTMNETMRLIGDKDYEQEWQDKVQTLGPFCLLLWDNPSNIEATKKGTRFYRGANLSDELISTFKKDCLKAERPIHSFQSFTSCSRDSKKAELFGNVLFTMIVDHAFSVNLADYSQYPGEEEELIAPGVCFVVNHVKFDKQKNKHMIYLELIQQYRRELTYLFSMRLCIVTFF